MTTSFPVPALSVCGSLSSSSPPNSAGSITALIEHVQTSLSQGDKISLPGVGHFEVAERSDDHRRFLAGS